MNFFHYKLIYNIIINVLLRTYSNIYKLHKVTRVPGDFGTDTRTYNENIPSNSKEISVTVSYSQKHTDSGLYSLVLEQSFFS